MDSSFVHRRPVSSFGFLALLMSSFNFALLAGKTTSDSPGLRLTVDPLTGDYAIGQLGSPSEVLTATVATKVDGRWVHARDYPNHTITESSAKDDLGIAHEWKVKHSGLAGAPELLCILHSYPDRPFGDIEVHVQNTSSKNIHIEVIRPVEATPGKILDLGGPVAAVRVLSDSFSEDRPAIKIHDLEDAAEVHLAVGSQLLYNRQS